jgi:hypothetical protein
MNNNFACIDVTAIDELVCCSLFIFQKIEFLFFIIGSIYLRLFNLIMYYISLTRCEPYWYSHGWYFQFLKVALGIFKCDKVMKGF